MDYEKIPLGVIPSKADARDYRIGMFAAVKNEKEFPEEFIVEKIPDIYNQERSSMCAAFSIAGMKESQEYEERGIKQRYSPMWIYGNRSEEDYLGEGMEPREALKNLVKDGVVIYSAMPGTGLYPQCAMGVKQYKESYLPEARKQRIKSYVRLYQTDEIQTALMECGPVLLGAAIYPSFYRARHGGIVPEKDLEADTNIRGYHAMLIVGWTKIKGKQYWVVNNSWGRDWGDKGRCYIPFEYFGIMELWSATDLAPGDELTIIMPVPMQILGEGHAVLPFRAIYESLNANVEWGRNEEGKVWARATVPANSKSVVIETVQGNNVMVVKRGE